MNVANYIIIIIYKSTLSQILSNLFINVSNYIIIYKSALSQISSTIYESSKLYYYHVCVCVCIYIYIYKTILFHRYWTLFINVVNCFIIIYIYKKCYISFIWTQNVVWKTCWLRTDGVRVREIHAVSKTWWL